MQTLIKNIHNNQDASLVLTKATVRAADYLGISHAMTAKILGISAASITRLYKGEYQLSQERKEWEFALLLIRIEPLFINIFNQSNIIWQNKYF